MPTYGNKYSMAFKGTVLVSLAVGQTLFAKVFWEPCEDNILLSFHRLLLIVV
jgi:hypothetical protein